MNFVVSGSHSSAAEDSRLLGHNVVSSGKWFPTFRKTAVASSSEDVTVFQNIGDHSPGDIVSRPRGLESWTYLCDIRNIPCVCVYVASIKDKHSAYLWCPNALRNADRNFRVELFHQWNYTPQQNAFRLSVPSASLWNFDTGEINVHGLLNDSVWE